MYRDMRKVYWWKWMNKNLAEVVSKFPNYQQVKVEHHKLGGMTQDIDIPN